MSPKMSPKMFSKKTMLVAMALIAVLPLFAEAPPVRADGAYDREAAAGYARVFALAPNPDYNFYGTGDGEDCTNFVSQALLSGGWAQIPGSLFDRGNTHVWWYDDWIPVASHTWVGAIPFYNFLQQSGRAQLVSHLRDLDVGDVIQMQWPGNAALTHTVIVTHKEPDGTLYVAQHSPGHLDEELLTYPAGTRFFRWHLFGPPSRPAIALYGPNDARFLSDGYPTDGTVLSPGQVFTKTWNLENTGSKMWGEDFQWAFVGGDHMGGPNAVDVPLTGLARTWSPAVALRAPSMPGTYKGYWQMRSPSGQPFGPRCYVLIRIGAAAPVTVSESDVVAYDGAAGFFRRGTARYWRDAWGVGDGGHMLWTWNNAGFIDNVGDWRPNLPAGGCYEVSVFVPRLHGTTTHAHYEVYHADGRTDVVVNQNNVYDAWVSLGTYRFNAGTSGLLRLTDMTGERGVTTQIGFDSAKWEPRN